jgi:hypothetical protein
MRLMMASPPETLSLDPGVLNGGVKRLCHRKSTPPVLVTAGA